MSEHREIRNAIVAKIQSIPDVGLVYPYERFAANEKAFRTLYAGAGERLMGWHVRRTGRREDAENNEVFTDWEIRGFFALDDASETELVFDDRIDSIIDEFRLDPTLGRRVLYPKDKSNVVPELADSGPCFFAGVLCHGAKLKYTTRTVQMSVRHWE